MKLSSLLIIFYRGFPGGPVVKNPSSSAGDMGSIPGRATKIPHAAGQLSPCTTTTEPTLPEALVPQLERENLHATTREKPAHRNEDQMQPKKKKEKIIIFYLITTLSIL